MLLQAIYGVVSKNILGFVSKKESGNWSWKKGLEDIAYGIASVLTVWGIKTLVNVDLTPDAASGTLVYLSLTWGWDKLYGIVDKKFIKKDKNYKLFS